MFIVLDSQSEAKVYGKPVATLPEGSLIGELEFLDNGAASAEVIVQKESRIIEIDNASLERLMKKYPRIGYVLMSSFAKIEAQRLRAMDK